MQIRTLLPDGAALTCETVTLGDRQILVKVSSSLPMGACPQCGLPSTRVHSHYVRRLSDLPWHGAHVTVQWRSRRFFCTTPNCPQHIFTERLPHVARPYSRKTERLLVAIRSVGFACGGENGSRLAERLGMPTSPDTILRIIRGSDQARVPAPKVIGIDDWAFRRGVRYGTIVCDLERRRPIDLLPERSADAVESWLLAHPSVEVISRDRGELYVKGATAGAPSAVQVVDRWHLLKNLREALARLADRHAAPIRKAVRDVAEASNESRPTSLLRDSPTSAVPSSPISYAENISQSRLKRLALYERVRDLSRQGLSQRSIARRLGIDRGTVARFVKASEFPERRHNHPHRCRAIDRFIEYLRVRWSEGCYNAIQLTGELKARGFIGSYHSVRRFVAAWRTPVNAAPGTLPEPRDVRPSANRVAWLWMRSSEQRTEWEAQFLRALENECPDVSDATTIAGEFRQMIHERRADLLDGWIDRARSSRIAIELRRFANGLVSDINAVRAALELPWSNGQTEGQVNRLKLIKRQMYGRAKFDLLRKRFLYVG
ncbi:MAG TPA: ISL3 family transposase [Planctomycetaceae bacterium]|nr:ISL3 family transposase [Planctomycetaceae bacterium]